MQHHHYNYGISGQNEDAYDNFLGFGKKAKARRKARRERKTERKGIRTDRMRIKNDGKSAEIDAVKAQTAIMRSTMGITNPSQSTSGSMANQQELYRQKNHPIARPAPPDLDNPNEIPRYGQDITMKYTMIGIGMVVVMVAVAALSKKGNSMSYHPRPVAGPAMAA
ncbi:MAG: hypothetical protein WBA74_03655 [Cyclobacteriaceae bacterium]